MSSRCLSVALLCCVSLLAAGNPRTLRVCADPNNLPYSNQRGEGFENRLAEIVAHDLGARLEYTWFSERKSFLKNSFDAGKCDVVMSVPATLDSIDATRPYYRSTYVFVSRKDRNLGITSLADPRLAKFRIGIHIVDDDYTPPAHALARRGLNANLVGYSLFGAYGDENPPAHLVDAVARGDVDLAIVWGPFAGYFAKQAAVPLEIAAVSPPMYLAVPFTYDIAAGVRKGDGALRADLDRVLVRECATVRTLLVSYGVPLVEEGQQQCEPSR